MIRHENIVEMYMWHKFMVQSDVYYAMVLEFIDGSDLCDFANEMVVSYFMVREIARQLCHTMSWVHENNYCHGDLKPENIMITDKTKNC